MAAPAADTIAAAALAVAGGAIADRTSVATPCDRCGDNVGLAIAGAAAIAASLAFGASAAHGYGEDSTCTF